jgi:hypothetical protein
MKLNPFIFGSKKVVFNSIYSPEEAVQRLRGNIEASLWDSWDKTAVVGKIKDNKVRLIWHRKYIRNSFQPFFTGYLRVKNGTTILEGKFSLHWIIKIFLVIWFGGIFAAGFLALYAGITEGRLRQLSPFFISVIGIGLAGVAIVFFGNWIARDSVDKISEVIEASFK